MQNSSDPPLSTSSPSLTSKKMLQREPHPPPSPSISDALGRALPSSSPQAARDSLKTCQGPIDATTDMPSTCTSRTMTTNSVAKIEEDGAEEREQERVE